MVEDVGRKAAALVLMVGGIFEKAHAAAWLQFGYDAAHSGFNRAERGDAYDAVSGAAPVSDSSTWATTLFNDTHWQVRSLSTATSMSSTASARRLNRNCGSTNSTACSTEKSTSQPR